MKESLTSLSIFLGGFVGFLTIVDWLLSKSQKKAIQNSAETIWYYLSEWQRIDLAAIFLKKTVLTLLLLLALGFVLFTMSGISNGTNVAMGILFCFAITIVALPRIIKWMTPLSNSDFFFFTFVWAYFIDLFSMIFDQFKTDSILFPVIVELHLMWFISLLWLAIIGVLKLTIELLGLITLRISESEKGPVLGLSALLVAIGAIVKAFL